MSDRFYCPESPVAGRLTICGDEAHHLARVRRVGVGEVVDLFNGRGGLWRAEVLELARDRVALRVIEAIAPGPPMACDLTLATALPKGDRVEWLVEKATELGVARLVPLVTARTVVDPRAGKLDRLRRRVVEAAKQCGRDHLMEIGEPVAWADLVRRHATPICLVAHPGGASAPSWPRSGLDRAAILAIGPEGGFADEEIALARSADWVPVSLGSTLLRVETAGLAGAAVILALAAGTDR